MKVTLEKGFSAHIVNLLTPFRKALPRPRKRRREFVTALIMKALHGYALQGFPVNGDTEIHISSNLVYEFQVEMLNPKLKELWKPWGNGYGGFFSKLTLRFNPLLEDDSVVVVDGKILRPPDPKITVPEMDIKLAKWGYSFKNYKA